MKVTKQSQSSYYSPLAQQALPEDTFSEFLGTKWKKEGGTTGEPMIDPVSNMPIPGSGTVTPAYMVNPRTKEKIPYAQWQEMEKEAKKAKKTYEYAKQGLDPKGRPIAPELQTFIDPTTGLMKEAYQYKPKELDLAGLSGYQALKERATGEGPSKWAQMALTQEQQQEAIARDEAAKQAQSSQAQAMSQLAMGGGLTSGARERIAMGGGRDLLAARQQASQEALGRRLGIMTEDERQRAELLPQFATSEAGLQQYNLGLGQQAQQYNIEQALKEQGIGRGWEEEQYKQQMAAWAAEKEAEATKEASRSMGGGSKGLLGMGGFGGL